MKETGDHTLCLYNENSSLTCNNFVITVLLRVKYMYNTMLFYELWRGL